MKLYLVRHAQSKRNIKIKSGTNTELTEDGKEQARRLGCSFKKIKIDKIYCSKLKRAKDTLKEIKKHLSKIPITYTDKINEHNMGIYEEKGKDDWAAYAQDSKENKIPFHEFKPKKGESLIETYEKAGKFYREIFKKHKSHSVLIVGHGIFSLYIILNAFGLPVTEGKYYRLSNASVSEMNINKQGKISSYHIDDFNHLIHEGLKLMKNKGARWN